MPALNRATLHLPCNPEDIPDCVIITSGLSLNYAQAVVHARGNCVKKRHVKRPVRASKQLPTLRACSKLTINNQKPEVTVK
jgi:hypothetical protein